MHADLPNVTPLPGAPNMFRDNDVAATAAAMTHAGNAAAAATGVTPHQRARAPFSPVQFQAFPQCAAEGDDTPGFNTLAGQAMRQPRTAAPTGLTLATAATAGLYPSLPPSHCACCCMLCPLPVCAPRGMDRAVACIVVCMAPREHLSYNSGTVF